MSSSVSSAILVSHKESQKTLSSIEATLNKIYVSQQKQFKLENSERKRQAQREKRSSGDVVRGMASGKKPEEKKGANILEKLLGILGKLGGGLLKGLGGAIGSLGPLLKLLKAGLVIKGLTSLTNLLGRLGKIAGVKNILDFLGSGIKKLGGGFKSLLSFFVGPKSIVAKIGGALKNFKIGKLFGKNFIKGGGIIAALTSGITKFFESGSFTDALFSGGGAGLGAIGGGILGSFLGPIGTIVGSALGGFIGDKLGGILKEQLDKVPWLKDFFSAVDKTFNQFITAVQKIGGLIGRFTQAVILPFFKSVGDFVSGVWKSFQGGIKWVTDFFDDNISPSLQEVFKFLNPIIEPLKKLALTILSPIVDHFKKMGDVIGKLVKFIGNIINPTNWVRNMGNLWESIGNFADAQYRQTGGPITVPGSGSGDKVPMMLPEGSFVLNRNAAGYQRGGIPTMLEPGESVYGPGQWGPREMMLNSAIPRFQSGGVVEASHPDTGSGFQPAGAKDYKGRPVIFSKSAAEGFAKAMNDSGGAVKGSDVASSKRSQAKNASLSGAHPNSTHLYGEGLDASGTTAQWLQSNPGIGWQYGYSHGPGSVHFNWKGGGDGLTPDNTPGDTYKTPKQAVQNMMGNAFSGLANLTGNIGELMKGVIGAAKDVFGPDLAMLMGGFGDMMGGAVSTMSGDVSGSSAPLSGDLMEKAKEMYEYIKGKGYTSEQAKGLLANIQRESTFNPAAKERGGTGHGLFQWSYDRTQKMINSVPNWQSNWKGQIDYALQEDVGPQYKSATSGMSARESAYWWMDKWERPLDRAGGDIKHGRFLESYQFQNGGGVSSVKASPQSRSLQLQSENLFIEKLASAIAPVVVPVGGGSGSSPSFAPNPGTQTAPPDLSAYPSNNTALDLSYRLSMGAAFA